MLNGNEFPNTCLRGIPKTGHQYFDNEGKITGYIFNPHSEQLPVNGFYKQSINWEDNDTVLEFTLSNRREDGNSLHFLGGVARILREEIDRIRQQAPFIDAVNYDREPIEENLNEGVNINPYHGNILLDATRLDNKNFKKALFSRLKRTITEVIPQSEETEIN